MRVKRLHRYAYKKRLPKPRKDDVDIGKMPTLGGAGGCWCGKPYGHDWPGASDGAPHPR